MALDEHYINQYQEMHKEPNIFPGQQTIICNKYIYPVLQQYNCSTLLDYGCGKAKQYFQHALHKQWGVKIALFDIGVPEYAIKPQGTFDAVLCIDVLEHIESKDVLDVLSELDEYANKVVIASVATRLAKKTLPDGRNAHLTVQPEEWWTSQIVKVAKKPWYVMFENQATGADRHFTFAYINVDAESRTQYQETLSSLT